MSSFLTRRDGIWHYARRVPASLTGLDGRGVVKRSTKVRVTDDPRGVKAGKVANHINVEVEAYWRGLGEGQAAEAKLRYEAARKRARALGFEYVPAADLSRRTIEDIIARLSTLDKNESAPNVAALLGGEQPPKIMLSRLFEEYEALTVASRADMSADQVRKWRNPRLRAVANVVAVIGDKPIVEISRDDAIEFQEWWQRRLITDEMDIGTANRDIGIVNRMLNVLDQRHRLGLGKVFSELRIEGGRTRSRTAFDVSFVQDRLLQTGALDSLNDEARGVLYLVAETGLRLSEAVNLSSATIQLDHANPHVRVRPDGRRMKTDQSERDIPLVGVALMAMRAHPNGFPRYRDKSAGLSATVNKALRGIGLRPEGGQTIYSLRHTFEDRLTAVEAPEKVIASLMGHTYSRPKYGNGPSLALKHKWLQEIAFTPPSTV